jgi:ABC-type antimicrobial peptide transport system permease subunit
MKRRFIGSDMIGANAWIYRKRIEDDEVVFWKLVFNSIRHRRVRVALNCTVIAVPLTLALTVIGFNPPARDSPVVRASINAHFATSAVTTRTSAAVSDPSRFRRLLTEVVEVILIASVAVTFLSMWANVLYRKHEIGILRSLGGSKVFVIGIVSTEAALIGLGGAILAVLFSQSILHCLNFLSAAAPPHSIGWKWCLITPCIIASTAVVGSFVACSLTVQQHVLDMMDDD